MKTRVSSSKFSEIGSYAMTKNISIFFLIIVLSCAAIARPLSAPNSQINQELVSRSDTADGKVEIYWASPKGQNKNLPAVVYVHGVQDATRPGALNFAKGGLLKLTANLDYIAVGMSMPGYGRSTGEADFCGAGSQVALRSVLTYLRSRSDVDPNRIVVSGISCGATVAAMIADKENVAAMILISGVYDFEKMYKKWHTPDWVLEPSIIKYISSCVSVDGGIKKASLIRSAILNASRFKAPVLLIAGGKDRIVDSQQSVSMAHALQTNGQISDIVINKEGGHMISYEDWVDYVNEFVQKIFSQKKTLPINNEFM